MTAPGTAPSRKWAAGSWASPVGSPEAQAAYSKLPADIAQRGTEAALAARRETPTSTGPTVRELLFRCVTEEIPRFSEAERHCQNGAIRLVRELLGGTPLAEFGPLKRRLVRDAMVAKIGRRVSSIGR